MKKKIQQLIKEKQKNIHKKIALKIKAWTEEVENETPQTKKAILNNISVAEHKQLLSIFYNAIKQIKISNVTRNYISKRHDEIEFYQRKLSWFKLITNGSYNNAISMEITLIEIIRDLFTLYLLKEVINREKKNG